MNVTIVTNVTNVIIVHIVHNVRNVLNVINQNAKIRIYIHIFAKLAEKVCLL